MRDNLVNQNYSVKSSTQFQNVYIVYERAGEREDEDNLCTSRDISNVRDMQSCWAKKAGVGVVKSTPILLYQMPV